MDNSPERNMAPRTEGRRSITMNAIHGRRSGTSTPKSFSAPMSPIPQMSVTSSRSKPIAENFAHYTQAVVNIATGTVHRDAVKARLEKQALEKSRWQKHYHGFATMAEEQTRQLRKSETSAERAEEWLKKLGEFQEKAIEGMTSYMVAASHGKPVPVVEESTRAKPVDSEVAMLRDDLHGTQRTLEEAVQDISRVNDRGSFQRSRLEEQIREIYRDFVTKQTLTATESKIAEAAVNISKLQAASVNQSELSDQISKLQEQLDAMPSNDHDKLNDKMIRIQDQVNRLKILASDVGKAKEDISEMSANASAKENDGRKLKEDFESHVQDFHKLKNDVTEQMEKLVELNDFVTGNGDADEKSLTDIVQEGVRNSAKHAAALQNLNNELGELDTLKEEFKSLGERMAELESCSTKQPSTSPDHDKSFNGLHVEVAILREEVARITREQQEKDDIVAEEVDRLGSLLNLKNGEVERLSKLLNTQDIAIKNMSDQILELRSRPIAASLPTASTPLPQANGVAAAQETLVLKIEELETSLKQFKDFSWEKMSNTEVFVASQEQRFNNLTTEHMMRSMINQMQRMYPPHPGNILNEINHVKGRQHGLENMLRSLETRLMEVRNFLGPGHLILSQKQIIPDLQVALRLVSDKVEKLAQTPQDSFSAIKNVKDLLDHQSTKIKDFEADINAIKQDHVSAVNASIGDFQAIKADIRAVNRDHLAAIETSKIDLQAIRADIKDIEATTIQECSDLHGEITALGERITAVDRKSSSVKKEPKPHPNESDHSFSPSARPLSSRRKKDRHLHNDAEDSDNSFSPSRQRAGSIRSAASAAKVKLANVTSNGTTPTATRKSRRKRERGSEGSESDWHPVRKANRTLGD